MNAAEFLLLLAVVVMPLLLGAAAALARKPWWWAAAAAVLLMLVAAIAPTPEAGEPRVVLGDLGFLVVVALLVTGLTWLGNLAARRFWTNRRTGPAASSR